MLSITSSAIDLINRVSEYLFPPLCIVCDSARLASDRWFCGQCSKLLAENHERRDSCPRCSQNRSARPCACEFAWDYPFESIISFLDYDELVASVMHQIKYNGKRDLALHLGMLLSPYLTEELARGYQMVIPIPLHSSRRRERGYNQAEWFARGLIAPRPELVIEIGAVERSRKTRTQTKLDKTDRKANIHGAFRLTATGKHRIAGKSILLIDDVVTTGATTAECAQVLIDGGCGTVKVVSLARD